MTLPLTLNDIALIIILVLAVVFVLYRASKIKDNGSKCNLKMKIFKKALKAV